MAINYFIPQGVEDTHCDKYEIKENIIKKTKDIFKSFGYRQILTPTFEYYDLFSNIGGAIHQDEMFKFIDRNGKILVLRPDITAPIARMVATNYNACFGYLKFSYAANIFRIHEAQNGMKREFTQAGIEYLGNDKPDSDAEVISLAIKSLINCGFKDFQIDLGQAGYFKGIIDELKLSLGEKKQIRYLIENKNLIELGDLVENLNIPSKFKDIILQIPYLYGKPDKVFSEANQFVSNEGMRKALENLKKVYDILCDYGYEKYISMDIGMINYMDYYTGVIFKGYVNNYGKAILSGGRYDNLSKEYGHYMPATGFGINIDEVLEAMKMCKMNNDFMCYTDYLILYDNENRKKGFELASKLRERGYIVESDMFEKNIKQHIQNANFRNIKEIIQLCGEKVKVINIRSNQLYMSTIAQFLKNINNESILASIH